jgi:hypothetical protein
MAWPQLDVFVSADDIDTFERCAFAYPMGSPPHRTLTGENGGAALLDSNPCPLMKIRRRLLTFVLVRGGEMLQ